MSIKDKVSEAVKDAMRAKEKEKLGVLRLIMSEFKQVEVDNKRAVLDEVQELAILDKMEKQRRDAASEFKKAGREDLFEKEQFEISVIQAFKPAQLSQEEVEKIIQDAIHECQAKSAQDMGKVMAVLKPKLQGRADLGQASAKVKALLSNPQ